MSKVKVTSVKQVCYGCPSQFSGETKDGQPIFAHYRYSHLTVEVAGETVYSDIYHSPYGGDGIISFEELRRVTKKYIEWPEICTHDGD